MQEQAKNKLIFTLTISNFTDSVFWRDDVSMDDTPSAFPSKIMPLSTQLITIEANPQLPQSINIEHGIRKTISAPRPYTPTTVRPCISKRLFNTLIENV
ncbi:hypothetical protein [Pseudomonas fluorescens]